MKKEREKMPSKPARRGTQPSRLRGGAFDEQEKLTSREREVLGCFGEGLGTDAIAKRLAISPVTVRNHSQRILAKLRVHSRLEAVDRGYREGLIRRTE